MITNKNSFNFTALESVWILGYTLNLSPCLPWSGFMKTVLKSEEFKTSRIETLPFINMDLSNPSTIYSALCFAQLQCEKNNQNVLPVTFDQPLYQKASEIVVASTLYDFVVFTINIDFRLHWTHNVRKWSRRSLGTRIC